MHKIAKSFVAVCVLFTGAWANASEYQVQGSVQADGVTPKLAFELDYLSPPGLKGEDLVEHFLEQKSSVLGILGLTRLELDSVRKSLSGTHYRYLQWLGKYRVENGTLVVSLDRDGRSVTRLYNTVAPEPLEIPELVATLSEDDAYDIAWRQLRPTGELMEKPSSDLLLVRADRGLRLAYRVRLAVEQPFGYWEIDVDARSGKVLGVRERSINETHARLALPEMSPVLDRLAAFRAWEREEAEREREGELLAQGARVDGRGLVFDPDPRTALASAQLQDSSPAAMFDAAYVERGLLDLTFAAGSYRLSGPWIRLEDFESPDVAPSTSPDGIWSAKRGDGAFNDAMTYFHIDQSQRYMQRLGFTGEHGIQGGPIGVDSNGLDGADNSHFIPGSNKVAFGWGCVDDNEDADVILHEYGHAIHYGINQDWGGGDAGAIGEGFGDYWAGSYSLTTANGATFQPETVFNWDGSPCWPGRRLNVMNAQYDPSKSYSAHTDIGGGIQSDELWSTPIFQAHLELRRMGIAREEIDSIVLESHFGLGSGVTMRELANVTVQTARRMFPNGPHAEVFTRNFVRHNILEVPHPVLEAGAAELLSAGSNGAADPGETIALRIPLRNTGTLGATGVRAVLSASTGGVSVIVAEASYGSIGVGAQGAADVAFQAAIPSSLVCGSRVAFNLRVTADGVSARDIPFALGTGVAEGIEKTLAPDVAIPDANSNGLTSTINVSGTGGRITERLQVAVQIAHSFIGDLRVTLVAPDGTRVRLHDRSGSGGDDIRGVYPTNLTPAEPLSRLVGKSTDGAWRLVVSDEADQDMGRLESWGIRDVARYVCE